jgi:hypothetical protein
MRARIVAKSSAARGWFTSAPPMLVVAFEASDRLTAAERKAPLNGLTAWRKPLSHSVLHNPHQSRGAGLGRVPPRLALGRRCEAPPQGSRRSEKGSRAVTSGSSADNATFVVGDAEPCDRSGCVNAFAGYCLPGGVMEAEMRTIAPLLAGFVAFAAVSTQAAPSSSNERWRPLGLALSFSLGDQVCGDSWHQALWRDWRGDWWWGPCVPDRSPAFVWRTPGWR